MPLIPREPEAWTRRWAQVAGACLLVGFVLPEASPTQWFWELVEWDSAWSVLADVSPGIAGLLALLLGTTMRVPAAAWMIILCGFVAAVPHVSYYSDLIDMFGWSGGPFLLWRKVLLDLGLTLGVSAIAASGHLREGFPTSRVARLLGGLGGLLLLSALAWDVVAERRIMFRTELQSQLGLGYLGVYAVVAIGGFWPVSKTYTRNQRVMGRLGLGCYPLYALAMTSLYVPELFWTGTDAFKWGLLTVGRLILVPLGVAALLEHSLTRKQVTVQAELIEVYQ